MAQLDRTTLAVVIVFFYFAVAYYLPFHVLSSWLNLSLYTMIFGTSMFALKNHLQPQTPINTVAQRMFQAISDNNPDKLIRIMAKSLHYEANILKELNTDGFTALQFAASEGKTECAAAIINFLQAQKKNVEKYLEASDPSGHTPLVLAIFAHHDDTAAALVEMGAKPRGTGPKNRNVLMLACMGSLPRTFTALQKNLKAREFATLGKASDALGYTALHGCCLAGAVDMAEKLFDSEAAEVGATASDGSTALHTAARRGDDQMIRLLVRHGARLNPCRFGCTPVHTAGMYGHPAALKALVELYPMAQLVAQDHDGMHPLHSIAQALGAATARSAANTTPPPPSDGTTTTTTSTPAAAAAVDDVEDPHTAAVLECWKILVRSGYPLDVTDFSNATSLYLLCWKPCQAQLEAIRFLFKFMLQSGRNVEASRLLRAKADSGWTCMHACKHMPGPASDAVMELLQNAAGEFAPEMVQMELRPERDTSNKAYLSRRGAHTSVAETDRRAVLQGDHTMHGVASYLRRIVSSGRMPKVVVVCGAGISTSAGIKDFRSSSGMYSDPRISRVFNADFFDNHPDEFYQVVLAEFKSLLPSGSGSGCSVNSLIPTTAHNLLRLLKDVNWLLRVYTQNIDMLERTAGLTADEVVECHGSLRRTVCSTCGRRSEDSADVDTFWTTVEAQQRPLCACGGVLRPDVVLFGEPLPGRFHQLAYTDVAACDLLLVMGTSLLVYPVAALPSFVQPNAVRMLFNREATGCFQGVTACNKAPIQPIPTVATSSSAAPEISTASTLPVAPLPPSASSSHAVPDQDDVGIGSHYRDLFYQGDCDSAAKDFAAALGLHDALLSYTKV